MARFGGIVVLTCLLALANDLRAQTYEVGTGKPYTTIGAVPWAKLNAGDLVLINWRSTAYKEKWVICRQGTSAAPITIRGVPNSSGQLPLIDGNGAITAPGVNFWSEERGVIKIGGANTPPDTMPKHIVIENLDIAGAKNPNTYRGDDNAMHTYPTQAASIFIEKGQNITIRNCALHDSGNGLFTAWQTSNLLVEKCSLYSNGVDNSLLMHNSYTEGSGVTFQYNYFGPLRPLSKGNNLKDRSAGTVIRYNWIDSGNREIDLVDSTFTEITSLPTYRTAYVYGNVLIERANAGNTQLVHYGGDSGTTSMYRKGVLNFYNNTLISQRTDKTTMIRLSTNNETADMRNNIFYTTAPGTELGLMDSAGIINLRNNWFKTGWKITFSGLTGTVNNLGGNITGAAPGFVNESGEDFHIASTSACINKGIALPSAWISANNLTQQYVKHRSNEARPIVGALDIGAFEFGNSNPPVIIAGNGDGLFGTYFDNMNFTGATQTRIDPLINFDWLRGSPISGIAATQFSVRWTGEVEAQKSETHTFSVQSDDGARLWVDNQLIIDKWFDHGVAEYSGSIALQAGVKYPIRLEYYNNAGGDVVRMYWSSASTPKALVPKSQLYSGAALAAAAEAPGLPDSDGDGLYDAYELGVGLDGNNPDTDGNGIGDADEFVSGGPQTHRDAQMVWKLNQIPVTPAAPNLTISSSRVMKSGGLENVTLRINGVFYVAADVSAITGPVTIEVNGMRQEFNLNKHGTGTCDDDWLRVRVFAEKSDEKRVRFKLIMRHVDLSATNGELAPIVTIGTGGNTYRSK